MPNQTLHLNSGVCSAALSCSPPVPHRQVSRVFPPCGGGFLALIVEVPMRTWLSIISIVPLLVAAQPRGWAADPKKEDLAGTWVVVSSQLNSREVTGEKGATFVIAGNKLTVKLPGKEKGHRFEIQALDPTRKPKEITLKSIENKDTVLKGIYELKGAELKLCIAHNTERPMEFAAPKGPGTIRLYILKREKQ